MSHRTRRPGRPVLASALTLAFAWGCGDADDAAPPEVDYAPASGETSWASGAADDPRVDVWARVPITTVESGHPYANNSRAVWDVQVPGARRLRVIFARFETESQYDPVELRDATDRIVARYSGRRGAFTSAPVEGDFTRISLRADASVAGYGVRVESVMAFGLGCLADADCGEGSTCPQTRRCIQAPCFQTCEADEAAPAPPTSPPTAAPAPPTAAPAPPTGAPPAPSPDAPTSPFSTAGDLSRGEEARFSLALPADARDIRVALTGTGDADLYTRFGGAPTTATYACRPYASDSAEVCTHARVDGGGPLHLMVRGYQASNDYALTVTWVAGAAAPPPPAPPTAPPASELDVSGTLSAGAEVRHQLAVRAGERVVVELTGTGDADLYTRLGAAPTLATWDCRPYAENANETCTVSAVADGTLHVLIHGYSAQSNYLLRTRR